MNHIVLTFTLYFLAMLIQFSAAVVALLQIKKIKIYNSGWILLSLGLVLMEARRIEPIMKLINQGKYSVIDSLYAFIISSVLLIGVLKIRKLFDSILMQENALAKLARRDTLTDCLSRYEIFEQGISAIAKSKRLSRPIAILVIDVDEFKKFNDNFGHATGDQVLIRFVDICKQSFRGVDFFGRFGGDEFVAILAESDLKIAQSVVSRIEIDLLESYSEFFGIQFKINASFGISVYDPNQPSNKMPSEIKDLLEYLIQIADLDMYVNKKLKQQNYC